MSLIDQMSTELRMEKEYIEEIILKNNRYKKYTISKNSASRTIYHPSKELKTLQYWLVNRVFKDLKISRYSTAYAKGCSIKENAKIHRNSNYILHTDIEKFFDNITGVHIEKVLEQLDLNTEDIEVIKKIVLYKNHLVIGSVSAPILSNCVMYQFDIELYSQLTKQNDVYYTRYADDIVISSKTFIPENILTIIDDILNKYGFNRNKKKTYFMSKKNRRIVTGITIDNNTDSLTLGHRQNKKIKKMLYNYLIKKEGDFHKIKGYLAYLKDINEDSYYSLKKKYESYGDVTNLFIDNN